MGAAGAMNDITQCLKVVPSYIYTHRYAAPMVYEDSMIYAKLR